MANVLYGRGVVFGKPAKVHIEHFFGSMNAGSVLFHSSHCAENPQQQKKARFL